MLGFENTKSIFVFMALGQTFAAISNAIIFRYDENEILVVILEETIIVAVMAYNFSATLNSANKKVHKYRLRESQQSWNTAAVCPVS